MEIRIQISDRAYQSLVAHGGRIKGSVGLVSPLVGNFNEYSQQPAAVREGERFIRLRHGKACVSRSRVSLRLNIHLNEAGICPAESIESESREAGHFVNHTLEDFRDTFGW
ncbi:cell division topological specificity factor [gut metagenome]|uniref:Cell division topological specificity factor n=1 Tax=gut metagenome TaxID=749906 RepID=J9C5I9_9ZZZZ